MTFAKNLKTLSILIAAAAFAGCASQPAVDPAPAKAPVAAAAPASTPATNAAVTEADTATSMEKRFQEAARSYKTVQKDGKTMYCKRERVIGTTIPTMQCLTEAQLRNQVENMEEYRSRARNAAKCTHGPGCGAGG
ncbi:MAG TPA: hypothetical protein VIV63_13700 [Steroidobacteraceae bacterium]